MTAKERLSEVKGVAKQSFDDETQEFERFFGALSESEQKVFRTEAINTSKYRDRLKKENAIADRHYVTFLDRSMEHWKRTKRKRDSLRSRL